MKKEKIDTNWDPYPPKWEPRYFFWDVEYLAKKDRFMDEIRPARIPERAARFIGNKLRRQREAKGFSVNDVAKGTLLQDKYIAAIEHGRFEVMPGGLYTRRFVEKYAKFINFDLTTLRTHLIPNTATAEVIKDSVASAIKYKLDKHAASSEAATKLPRFGELLLYYFLSPEERESFFGDIEEKYESIETKFGVRAAEIFFYKEILDSMSPLVGRLIVRLILSLLDGMK